MRKLAATGLALMVLASVSGCASTALIGDKTTHTGRYHGSVGITGHLNELTIEPGSRLTKLSILGDGNVVHIDPDATLAKIDIFGGNNRIYVPENLIVRFDQVGRGNRIIRESTVNIASDAEDTDAPVPNESEETQP